MEKRIQYLLDRFQHHLLTASEKAEILQLSEEFPALFQEEILDQLLAHQPSEEVIDQQKWQELLALVVATDHVVSPTQVVSFRIMKWLAAAVVLLAASLTFYIQHSQPPVHQFTSDINPGGNKAILELADGRKIALSDIKNGSVIRQNGVSIAKTTDGHLVYTDENPVQDTAANQYNTVTTPNGGEWELRLADGSTVWLNAASSLSYPSNIGSVRQRKVILQGEAYFEVAKDKAHPFLVETKQQTVEVLGTHFNINCYQNENITRTTLLEGRVKISNLSYPGTAVLKPGEQSAVSTSGINIIQVNTDESIAWKNGYFMFNNERQESIMRKIARWYNVEIDYADPAAKEVMYYGTVSKFEKISKVLRKLEQTGEVRFEIKGNKIIIHKD